MSEYIGYGFNFKAFGAQFVLNVSCRISLYRAAWMPLQGKYMEVI